MLEIVLEYVIVFLLVFVIHYVMFRSSKKGKKGMPTELLYLEKVYQVNVKKINYQKFSLIYSLINTFIITTIYIILVYLLNNLIMRVIVGVVLLILMIIICYGFLARYYLWKEGRK